MEYPFNAYSLTDLLDELEFNKSSSLKLIEYNNLNDFFSEYDNLINSQEKNVMMPYVIIINFENENTYTLIFHIYYDQY